MLPLSQDINILLKSFGLALPSDEPYSDDDMPTYDIDALSAISLPLRSTLPYGSNPFPYSFCESSRHSGSAHDNVKFSKSTFDLPSNADLRIKSFLSFFGLEAMNPGVEAFHCSHQSAARGAVPSAQAKDAETTEGREKAKHGLVCCENAQVKPHWQMWTIAQTDGRRRGRDERRSSCCSICLKLKFRTICAFTSTEKLELPSASVCNPVSYPPEAEE